MELFTISKSVLPADVWFDAFAFLPRPYLDTLQITSRIHRHVVGSLLPKLCLRRINVAYVQHYKQGKDPGLVRIRVLQHFPGQREPGRNKKLVLASFLASFSHLSALLANSWIKLLRFSGIGFLCDVWPARFRERVRETTDLYVSELLFDNINFCAVSVDEFNAFVLGFQGTRKLKFNFSATTPEQSSNGFLEKTVQKGMSDVFVHSSLHDPLSPHCSFDENAVVEACRSFCDRLRTTDETKNFHLFLNVPNLALRTSQLVHRLVQQAYDGGLEKLVVTVYPIAPDAMFAPDDLTTFRRPKIVGRLYDVFDIPDERGRVTLLWHITTHLEYDCRYLTLHFKRTSSSK
ncbi:hypothetical protein AAVH_16111 [Aphelenchoides avenae]|nr:hypothetical protein AAVH_16111 [Aphelenchus avenae]